MIKYYKLISLLILTVIVFLMLPVGSVSAANIERPDLQIEIGGFTQLSFSPISCSEGKCTIKWIGEYVAAIYRYGVGLAAILAVIMIMVGGFIWLTSGGSTERIGRAKEFIISALSGLVLALFSFILLYTVNPRLVALEPLIIERVKAPDTTGDVSLEPEEPEPQICCLCQQFFGPVDCGWGPPETTAECESISRLTYLNGCTTQAQKCGDIDECIGNMGLRL